MRAVTESALKSTYQLIVKSMQPFSGIGSQYYFSSHSTTSPDETAVTKKPFLIESVEDAIKLASMVHTVASTENKRYLCFSKEEKKYYYESYPSKYLLADESTMYTKEELQGKADGEFEDISQKHKLLPDEESKRDWEALFRQLKNMYTITSNHIASTKSRTPIDYNKALWYRGVNVHYFAPIPAIGRLNYKKYIDESAIISHMESITPTFKDKTLFDVLAILQHHGIPTRFLDWSTNVLPSLLFSVMETCDCSEDMLRAEKISDGKLFILNPYKLNYHTIGKFGLCRPDHPQITLRTLLATSEELRLFAGPTRRNKYYTESISKTFFDLIGRATAFLRGIEKPKYDYYYEDVLYGYLHLLDSAKDSSELRKIDPPVLGEIFNSDEARNLNLMEKIDFLENILHRPLIRLPAAAFANLSDPRIVRQQGSFTVHGGKNQFDHGSSGEVATNLPTTIDLDTLNYVITSQTADEKVQVQYEHFLIDNIQVSAERKTEIKEKLSQLSFHELGIYPADIDSHASYIKSAWTFKYNMDNQDKQTNKSNNTNSKSALTEQLDLLRSFRYNIERCTEILSNEMISINNSRLRIESATIKSEVITRLSKQIYNTMNGASKDLGMLEAILKVKYDLRHIKPSDSKTDLGPNEEFKQLGKRIKDKRREMIEKIVVIESNYLKITKDEDLPDFDPIMNVINQEVTKDSKIRGNKTEKIEKLTQLCCKGAKRTIRGFFRLV